MNDLADYPAVSTLVGTPREVQDGLARTNADRVLVLAFEHVQPNVARNVAESLSTMASSMFDVLASQDKESLERLVGLLVPPAPPSPRLLREARMLARVRKAVLESGDWLTAAQVAEAAQLSTRNPSAQPNKWKKQGLIFAVHHGGIDYFPGYALDPAAAYRPFKALAGIIDVLSPRKDAWGMAYWFASDNSLLGGRRPQDLLATEPGRVFEAARDEVREIAHG